MRKIFFRFSALLLVAGCHYNTDQSSASKPGLVGAWKIVSSEILIPDGSVRPGSFHENLFLFTEDYYSMGSAGGPETSPYYKERFNPDDGEKLARYGTMLVNSGKYTVSGNELSIIPEFAIVPEFVAGKGVFDFSIVHDTLQLTWHTILSADSIPDPFSKLGVKWRYRLVRID